MLQTKSIFKEIEETDGFRISIMSRHKMDGEGEFNFNIEKERYNVWMRVFAPPLTLVGSYYKRGMSFEEYSEKYLEYIRNENVAEEVQKLAKKAKMKTFTLLCMEKEATKCHRKLLAEECKKYEPDLIIRHI